MRGLDRLPAGGPALVVGNHSCLFYVPEAWTCAQAILSRRGISAPAYLLAYDLLFALPGVGPTLRRLGVVPAGAGQAEAALANGAYVLVYPGGDLEACRPWIQRDKADFGGRKGFVQLALRCRVPVVPVAAHGGHHAIVVLARGDRLARAAGLRRLRINVFPLLAGPPFGINTILTPPRLPTRPSSRPATPTSPDGCKWRLTVSLPNTPTRYSSEAHGSPRRQQPARYSAPETSKEPLTQPTKRGKADGGHRATRLPHRRNRPNQNGTAVCAKQNHQSCTHSRCFEAPGWHPGPADARVGRIWVWIASAGAHARGQPLLSGIGSG